MHCCTAWMLHLSTTVLLPSLHFTVYLATRNTSVKTPANQRRRCDLILTTSSRKKRIDYVAAAHRGSLVGSRSTALVIQCTIQLMRERENTDARIKLQACAPLFFSHLALTLWHRPLRANPQNGATHPANGKVGSLNEMGAENVVWVIRGKEWSWVLSSWWCAVQSACLFWVTKTQVSGNEELQPRLRTFGQKRSDITVILTMRLAVEYEHGRGLSWIDPKSSSRAVPLSLSIRGTCIE